MRNIKRGRIVMRKTAIRLTKAMLASILLIFGVIPMTTAQSPDSDLESEFLMELLLDVDPQLDAGHTSVSYTHLTLPTTPYV